MGGASVLVQPVIETRIDVIVGSTLELRATIAGTCEDDTDLEGSVHGDALFPTFAVLIYIDPSINPNGGGNILSFPSTRLFYPAELAN